MTRDYLPGAALVLLSIVLTVLFVVLAYHASRLAEPWLNAILGYSVGRWDWITGLRI